MNDDDFAELFRKLPGSSSSGTSWQDVGAEFEALARTLGDAVRGAWQRQDPEAGLSGLNDALDALIREVNRAVDGTPEAQVARTQLVDLTEKIRAALERAGDDLRPGLLSLLRQANAELRKLTRLDE